MSKRRSQRNQQGFSSHASTMKTTSFTKDKSFNQPRRNAFDKMMKQEPSKSFQTNEELEAFSVHVKPRPGTL